MHMVIRRIVYGGAEQNESDHSYQQRPDQRLNRSGAGGAGHGLHDRGQEFHRGHRRRGLGSGRTSRAGHPVRECLPRPHSGHHARRRTTADAEPSGAEGEWQTGIVDDARILRVDCGACTKTHCLAVFAIRFFPGWREIGAAALTGHRPGPLNA